MSMSSIDITTVRCITTKEVSNRLKNIILSTLSDAENTLVEAPTSLGKTHHIATTPWREYSECTAGEPVIHLHKTTDARDQAADMSKDAGIDYKVLKNRRERCPVANGDYNDECTAPNGDNISDWFDWKCDKQGYPFSDVHNHLERELEELPCQHDGECGGAGQWNNVPRKEDSKPGFDVIHATHQFARVKPLIEDANVIVDERPDYTEDIEHGGLRQAVNDHLDRIAPEQSYTWPTLIAAVINEDYETLTQYQNLLEGTSDERPPLAEGDSHRLSPTLTRALASAEPAVENRFRGTDGQTTIVIKDNGDKQLIRRQPAFSEARCIVGLDAHPSKLLWEFPIRVYKTPLSSAC